MRLRTNGHLIQRASPKALKRTFRSQRVERSSIWIGYRVGKVTDESEEAES